MSWWQRLFGREKKPKAQTSPTTASSVTATARPSGTQKDAAVEMQLKIVYARVEELASRIPRNTDWNETLGNFAKNLYAARRALTDGRDMHGNPISRSDIAAGLRRMCDSYSGPTSLSILGGIHGSGIRKEFEEILERTLAIANTVGGDLIDERHLHNLLDGIRADLDESAKQFEGELKEIKSMTLDQLKATLSAPNVPESKKTKAAWRLGELNELVFLDRVIAQETPHGPRAVEGIGHAGNCGNAEAIDYLERALRHTDPQIQQAAQAALRSIASGTPAGAGKAPTQEMSRRSQKLLSRSQTIKCPHFDQDSSFCRVEGYKMGEFQAETSCLGDFRACKGYQRRKG